MRLRSTAEQEEVDGEDSECVYEIVPMQETVDLHKCRASAESMRLTLMSYTDVFQRRVYGLNKQDAWLNCDVGKPVI